MKNITTIVFTLIFTLSAFQHGNAQNRGQVSTGEFRNCITSIQTTNSEQIRYDYAIQFFLNEHCTTLQLQDVCYYLSNDEAKYKLCMAAYPRIIDKDNFFNIYNSFSLFSYAIKLYHNTQVKDGFLIFENNNQLNVENDNKIRFDRLIQQGDMLFASNKFDEAIESYEQAMTLKPGDQTPYLKIKEVNRRKLELADTINEENDKNAQFNLLIQKGDILLLSNKFDEAIEVYEQAMILKPEDQMPYLKIKEVNIRKQSFTYVETDCSTGNGEFSQIMKVIKDEGFTDDQKQMAKNYIADKCLSIEQLKSIVSLFSMDDDKLEVIKYIYNYIKFPEKMYLFRTELTYSSTKEEFDQFLRSKE